MSSETGKTDDQLRATGPRGHRSGSDDEKTYGDREGRRSRGERETALAIPTELCEELSALAAKKGFQSVQEFVIYILREEATRGQSENGTSAYSAHELELIRKLLQGAGDLE